MLSVTPRDRDEIIVQFINGRLAELRTTLKRGQAVTSIRARITVILVEAIYRYLRNIQKKVQNGEM